MRRKKGHRQKISQGTPEKEDHALQFFLYRRVTIEEVSSGLDGGAGRLGKEGFLRSSALLPRQGDTAHQIVFDPFSPLSRLLISRVDLNEGAGGVQLRGKNRLRETGSTTLARSSLTAMSPFEFFF